MPVSPHACVVGAGSAGDLRWAGTRIDPHSTVDPPSTGSRSRSALVTRCMNGSLVVAQKEAFSGRIVTGRVPANDCTIADGTVDWRGSSAGSQYFGVAFTMAC